MRSTDQVQRLIQLVPYLTQNPGVTVTEVARDFRTTPAVILRDLEVIQFCGLPGGLTDDLFDIDIEGVRADGEIYLYNSDVLARPMTLTAVQAASLMVALGALVELGSDAAASARAKLSEACGQAGTGIEVTLTAGDEEIRRVLTRACEERRVVRIEHEGTGGRAVVEVEPARLRVVDGTTYLDAWSRLRDAWRSFRMDRIRAVVMLDETSPQRDGLEEATGSWFADSERRVELSLRPGAAWVPEYYPTHSVESDVTGLKVVLPVGSRDWLVSLLLRLGEDVVIVSDGEAVTEAAARAREALRAYESSKA